MSVLGLASVLVAIALLPTDLTGTALATCSPSALDAVHTELRDAAAPDCGTKPLRRAFKRARRRAATATARAGLQCAIGGIPRIATAHRALMKALAQIGKLSADGKVPSECAVAYETELERLDADLTAAANGTATTTTTSPPGAPTTTTLPTCTMISLEVDRGDCTDVTSEPPGLVECAGSCDVKTFTVPAFGSLQLKGMPAPGDTGVLFGGNCNDDGTVLLGDAALPDCSLSCDCSSTF